MELHFPTLSLIIGTVTTVATVIVYALWVVNKQQRGPGVWAWGAALLSLSWSCVSLLQIIPLEAVIFLNNYLSIVGIGLIYEGILRYQDIGCANNRRTPYFTALLLLGLILIYTSDKTTTRHIVLDPFIILILLASTKALLKASKPLEKKIHALSSTTFIIFAGTFFYRWILAINGSLEGWLPSENPATTPLSLGMIIWVMGWTYGFSISLNLRSRERMEFLAYHDALTGLPNRHTLDKIFPPLLQRFNEDEKKGFALALVDINGFKPLNDTYGHLFGDEVIKAVAKSISEALRPGDTVIRYGGDEFLILLPRINDSTVLSAVCTRIKEGIESKVQIIEEREVQFSLSIGEALCPTDGKELDTLLKYADCNLYCAKERKSFNDRCRVS